MAMTVQDFLIQNRSQKEPAPDGWIEFAARVPSVKCVDGAVFSIQCHATAYCEPKKNVAVWTHAEVKPIGTPCHKLAEYYEESGSGIAAFVPMELIESIVQAHGGIENTEPEVYEVPDHWEYTPPGGAV